MIETSARENNRLKLYKRRQAPSDTITVAAEPPFTVIVRPVRAALFLEAEDATIAPASQTALATLPAGFTGRGAVTLSSTAGSPAAIAWTFAVGVGDRYGLNVRYTTIPTADATRPAPPLSVEQQIIAADGRVLRTDTLTFPLTAYPKTWSTLRTRTASSINAGTYQLRLTLLSPATSLLLDSLEVE